MKIRGYLGFLALQGRHNVPSNVKFDKHGRAYHRLTLVCQIFPLLKKLMAFVRRIPTPSTFRQLLSSWRTVHASTFGRRNFAVAGRSVWNPFSGQSPSVRLQH